MGEKYANLVGRVHLVKESIREKWASTKEEGGITHTIGTKVDQVKEDVIGKINHGDQTYDHLYRLELTVPEGLCFKILKIWPTFTRVFLLFIIANKWVSKAHEMSIQVWK